MSLSEGMINSSVQNNLPRRKRMGKLWETALRVSTLIGILSLFLLIINILNDTIGYRAVRYTVDPSSLTINNTPVDKMSNEQLITVLENNLRKTRLRTIERQKPLKEQTNGDLYQLVQDEIIKPEIEDTWNLLDSLVRKDAIINEVSFKYPHAQLVWVSWLNLEFITHPQHPNALRAGIRTALLGSIWTIIITIAFALPLGIGAAIYLEEYATDNWLNRLIRTNINNLAGVPSIIYGLLGLAVFVRGLEPVTSGAFLGYSNDSSTVNGRTILSAGLTLALLVLPILIINAQEAIRAVPKSLREASYGLGATQWQTIWHHVLPGALPGILTGTILAVSRAIGETAPLVVIGAATYISFDPTGPFSKFTTLPIQIYQWTSRPQNEFRNLASAAIVVLLGLLLTMNAAAIWLRNRYSRR